MGLHKLTAGDGYMYLLRQVAVADGTDLGRPASPTTTRSKGETPGRWMGSGLTALGRPVSRDPDDPLVAQLWGVPEGSEVTEDQMKALFGEGLHPNATRSPNTSPASGCGSTARTPAPSSAARFGWAPTRTTSPAGCAAPTPTTTTPSAATTNAPLDPAVRAEIRTTVAAEMFTEPTAAPPQTTAN